MLTDLWMLLFSGMWSVEDDQNPVYVKSRTGFVIICIDYPLLWISKLQTQVAMITMDFKYNALSRSMRELSGIRKILI